MAGIKKEDIILCMGHNSEYLKCNGNKKENTDFFNSWSPFKGNGKVDYCKDCVQKIYDYYLKLGSMQAAIYYTCQVLDVAFIAEIYEKVNNRIKDGGKKTLNPFTIYITELQKYTTKKEIWFNFSCSDVDLADIDTRIKTNEVKKKEIEQFELDWGKQSSIEDYSFLEYIYDELTDNKILSKPQEMLYRDLCLARLTKRKIDGNEIKDGDITKVQTQILNLMTKLKIDKFDEQRDKSDVEKILERQIWEIENTEPCEVVNKEEYKDFLDIGKNWGKHILRAMKNILSSNREYPDITKDGWD